MGLGIAAANEPGNAAAGAQLVGMIDFRLHWPDPDMAYIGILLVAEPFQRQRVGSDAWALLEPWLADEANLRAVKLGVEQFNPGALKFFQTLGFSLTGEAQRIRSGKRLVRLLAMEKVLKGEELAQATGCRLKARISQIRSSRRPTSPISPVMCSICKMNQSARPCTAMRAAHTPQRCGAAASAETSRTSR